MKEARPAAVWPEDFLPEVSSWFLTRVGEPTSIQLKAWAASESSHALISAPTGSGKTLAAFLGVLNRLFVRALAAEEATGPAILYISPLKALSNDIEKNLNEPLSGIGSLLAGRAVAPRVMVRTGDSSQRDRQRMFKEPPDIIVTTPESLYVLLTSQRGRQILAKIETVIVDEIHALIGSRRGAHLSLSLERLTRLTGQPFQRIGISATVRPLEKVAQFLAPGQPVQMHVDQSQRPMDIAFLLPERPLDAILSQEGWAEINKKLIEKINQYRTTIIFVNNRRLCERLARQLSDLLGQDLVGAHHGSLATARRLQAEQALKAGQLKVIVATASLELGIDIGSVDLVVQIGSPRSIHGFLQRIGRAEHHKDGTARALLVPLTRDDLVECMALLQAIQQGELEESAIPEQPVDILAQQLVAELSCQGGSSLEFLEMFRRAYPYRNLSAEKFEQVLEMLSRGYSLRFGRRSRYVFYDRSSSELVGRPGARLAAILNGGAIADTFEYEVVLENENTFLGTVHEDFAIESLPGDVFQLGNAYWRILRIATNRVFVAEAPDATPSMPFWIAEAPGRTAPLSAAVSRLRDSFEAMSDFSGWLLAQRFDERVVRELSDYFAEASGVLGRLPTRANLILERFFDEAGDCHLVLHSPYGIRINRAWGLALRKRFCRKFNFELQAAATDDAILFSLSRTHSFALPEVFDYLKSGSVERILIQALLAAPMFEIRWRWNASRSLAILRQQGGRRTPPQIQKSQAQDLVALLFPDQLACAENLAGEREIPDHPLVEQTIEDCLTEAMDIQGLRTLLEDLEAGKITTHSIDTAAPSVLAHEVINARPYAFLDDAPLEERRTRAVRTDFRAQDQEFALPDSDVIGRVREDRLQPRSAMELYDQLCSLGIWRDEDSIESEFTAELIEAGKLRQSYFGAEVFWHTADYALLGGEVALDHALRGHLELLGPVTTPDLVKRLPFALDLVESALLRYVAEGWLFPIGPPLLPQAGPLHYCERSFFARMQSYQRRGNRNSLFSEEDYERFLPVWQHAHPDNQLSGVEGLARVLGQLQGLSYNYETWLSLFKERVADFSSLQLDSLFLSGRFVWLRPGTGPLRRSMVRRTPFMILERSHLHLAPQGDADDLSTYARTVFEFLSREGASFLPDIKSGTSLFDDHLRRGISELLARGLLCADSLLALETLLMPASRRQRRPMVVAGRWSLLRIREDHPDRDLMLARLLLDRHGILLRRQLEKEPLSPPWSKLVRTLRRLEMQGEVRGGRFIREAWGEQFALPGALGLLARIGVNAGTYVRQDS